MINYRLGYFLVEQWGRSMVVPYGRSHEKCMRFLKQFKKMQQR